MAPTCLKKIQILATVLFLLFPFLSRTQIQVNSVNTTPATCPNNGTITIAATTTSPPLFYSITAGPVSQPVQTNPVFNSLLPGNYTIKITDGAGNQTTANATITGTYQNPDFTIADNTPHCVGQSNGKLEGNVIPGNGLAPFSWQLVAPSPVIRPAQNSGLFENLPAGNYSMRVTDACGSIRTNAFVLQNPDTRFGFYHMPIGQQGSITAQKVGCDSMLVTYWLGIPNPRMPLTFKYPTSNGVFIPASGTTIDSTNLHIDGGVMVSQIIPGMDYGDEVTAHIYNSCGDSAVSTTIITHPFVFYPRFSFNGCGNTANVTIANTPTQDYHTSIKPTAAYSLTNVGTSAVVQSGSVTVSLNNGIITQVNNLIPGDTYRFAITDGCGETFQTNFIVPGIAPPLITHEDIVSPACIDSVVGTYRVLTAGFGNNARMIVLSGPATLGSTKPEFEYTDVYAYPDTLPMFNGEAFLLNNLAIGTYQYKIIDDCGNEVLGSVTITPQQVTSLKRTTSFKKGCPGQNKIFYSIVSGGNVKIRNITTNTVLINQDFDSYTDNNLAAVINRDSLESLSDGTYEVTYQFLPFMAFDSGTEINEGNINCWKRIDTLTIEPYEFPEISTENVILCHSTIHLELIPDTTKGVQPYEYEIIAGPQVFPEQSSNVFTIGTPGIYTVRILDFCGNASAKQIAVDTLSFDPLEIHPDCFSANLYFPASIYSTYEWLMPNNQVHVGDSLILDPVTPADTGMYSISKIVSINGCVDTLQIDYHVTLRNRHIQTIPFCAGTDVTVGPNTYDLPGTYNDTLAVAGGCDSIVTTHLVLLPQNTDTLHVSICPQGSYLFGGNTYVSSGFYRDTLVSVQGCDSISVLHLTLRPYIRNAVSETICNTESFSFGGNLLTQQGIYIDTFATATCDSIVTLTLQVVPLKYHTLNETICAGGHYVLGGVPHSQTGTYTSTFPNNGCDSIVTLHLTVLPYKYNTLTENICQGDSYTVGHNTYTLPGTYKDTIPTANCDSIVTLTLHVLPKPTISMNLAAFYCHQTGTVALSPTPAGGTLTGNFVTGTGTGLDLSAAAPGNYSVTYSYTAANGCESTLTQPFLITTPLTPNFNYFVDCFQKATFINTTPVGPGTTTYTWSSVDGSDTATTGNPSMTFNQPGNHLITMTATDSYHCTYKTIKSIFIEAGASIKDFVVPNVITPNGDGVNDVLSIPAALEGCMQYKILILNRWGNLVYEMTSAQNAFSGIDIGGKQLTAGVYFYLVESNDLDCEGEYGGACSGTITIVR